MCFEAARNTTVIAAVPRLGNSTISLSSSDAVDKPTQDSNDEEEDNDVLGDDKTPSNFSIAAALAAAACTSRGLSEAGRGSSAASSGKLSVADAPLILNFATPSSTNKPSAINKPKKPISQPPKTLLSFDEDEDESLMYRYGSDLHRLDGEGRLMVAGDALIQLYHNFISDFETKINLLKLAQFVVIVSRQYSEKEAASLLFLLLSLSRISYC
ncbi:hypothetical protein CASFOL_023473 [Castilleja foliolosa]|uniref:PSD13 N-terminal domain-containing protein n=1 Tax=Castilleja foliolosa TaxID=1961234 RepID=A0ABD3CMM4_9LAMI